MKNLKYTIYSLIFISALATSCQDEDQEFGDILAPTNLQVVVDKEGADSANPNGDGSGRVNFTATADNATSFHFIIQDITKLAQGGQVTHDFTTLGENTYQVTIIAFGTGGSASTTSIDVDVLSLYEPPAELVQMLYGSGSRVWRVKDEAPNHFGLGPVGGDPFSYYGANPGDKSGVGMYDDRYIFNQDGSFTHITNAFNDDPTTDTNGTIVGREVLINELVDGSGGFPNGADIENYDLSDYEGQHTVTAPSGVETITLTGTGFIAYYVGGNHTYVILSRSENEMVLKTTDGNNEFDWGFTLIADD